MKTPSPLAARAIGFYAKGCLAGGKAIPVDGPTWQVMRLSRNRNWGHPRLISLVERLAVDVKAHDGWNGLLVGDISQPRGGPMLTGHASHQIGLDADIWLTPMPDRRLTRERTRGSVRDVDVGRRPRDCRSEDMDRGAWSPDPACGVLFASRARARQPGDQEGAVREQGIPAHASQQGAALLGSPLSHAYSHVLPEGQRRLHAAGPVGSDDGCGKEVDDWIKLMKRIYAPRPKPKPNVAKPKPKPQPRKPEITLADLPAACKLVIGNTSPPGPSPVSDVTKPEPEAAETDDKPDTPDDKAAKPTVAGKK